MDLNGLVSEAGVKSVVKWPKMLTCIGLLTFSTAIHLHRAFSCILESFSWTWDGIVTDPQDFSKFAQRLRNKVLSPSFSFNSVFSKHIPLEFLDIVASI